MFLSIRWFLPHFVKRKKKERRNLIRVKKNVEKKLTSIVNKGLGSLNQFRKGGKKTQFVPKKRPVLAKRK